MIDLHAHILPGLDHGAADERESLEMASLAAGDGITVLAGTPHVNHEFRAPPSAIRDAARALRERINEAGIPLEIVVGADYHLTPELLTSSASIVTLGDNGRYFLLELPPMVVPPEIARIIKAFLAKGLTPIITHPERNDHLRRCPSLLDDMIKLGCPMQVTAGSLLELFGPSAAVAARNMLKRGQANLMASDAHWPGERPPLLSASLEAAAGILGAAAARILVDENPRRILRAEDVLR